MWTGHWPADPWRVSGQDAEKLLNDPERYTFESEGKGLERVYFVNVSNIP